MRVVRPQQPRKPEIRQVGLEILVQQNIARFYVTVDNVLFPMQIGQPAGRPTGYPQPRGPRKGRTRVDPFVQPIIETPVFHPCNETRFLCWARERASTSAWNSRSIWPQSPESLLIAARDPFLNSAR
ncbi:ankyrin repeat family protein [Striga asiatica]|uniref:Ankyrin repeat family protein n=1 Tax=Striga asiatica TaxID=4170 RepID=A0A5A7RC04_STRAF|nr:ankyrin repeat family protein [Striga asiatica]